MAKQHFRKEIKKGRQAFYQAAIQARQVGNFVSNPIAFSWRVVRQGFTNWLNAPEEKEDTRNDAAISEITESSSVRADGQTTDSPPSDATLTTSTRQYAMTTYNLSEGTDKYIYGGYGNVIGNERFRYPVLIEKVRRDRYEHPDRVFSTFSASNAVQESEYQTALKFRILLPKCFIQSHEDRQYVYVIYSLQETCINTQELVTLSQIDGSFNPIEVDGFLKDIWQSLEYLHNHLRYREELHIAHGNISLDTLLMSEDKKIYIWRLGLWEKRFTSSYTDRRDKNKISIEKNKKILIESNPKEQDIKAVGLAIDRLVSEKLLSHYEMDNTVLQDYLKEVKNGVFRTAREANKRLLNLNIARHQFWEIESQKNRDADKLDRSKINQNSNARSKPKKESTFWWLLIFFLSGVLGIIWTRRMTPAYPGLFKEPPQHNFSQNCFENLDRDNEYYCQMKQVWSDRDKTSSFTQISNMGYTGVWNHIVRATAFKSEIKQRAELNRSRVLGWKPISFDPLAETLDRLPVMTYDSDQINSPSTIGERTNHTIAYDGLVVFASPDLAKSLNGQISLENLYQLYSGQIDRWNELEGVEDNFREIALFRPENPELVQLFRDLAFQAFSTDRSIDFASNLAVTELPIQDQISRVANSSSGAIGFAPLSAIFGQCRVYPLAIIANGETVQPFVNTYNQPISLATELCDDKGGYGVDFDRLTSQKYPLGYRLVLSELTTEGETSKPAIVELLRTDEGQSLLRSLGLVPCRTPNKNECEQSGIE
ncbi:MAG: hypothetical protein J7641_17510 [Cyanobacteria bacterium SID2]|nr:hypothetical protein [Cyanobacteria bacterium SID2]